jgi:hypothetical protein
VEVISVPNRLEEIEPDEISLVDVPATKRKFLFTKAAGGESYLVCACGHEEALVDFLKSASGECPGCGESLEDSAIKIILKRGIKMKKKLSELIKDFIGEDELSEEEIEELEKAEKKIPPDAAKALKAVVTTLNKFKADFPDEIKECINTLAKYAAYGYGYPAKKAEKPDEEEEEDVEKAGAKLSKATRELIKNAVVGYKLLEKAMEALKTLVKEDTQKSAEILLIEEKMNQLSEKMDQLFQKKSKEEEEKKKKTKTKKEEKEEEEVEEEEEEETEEEEAEAEVKKEMQILKKRVAQLEEKKGTKKSLTGQDEEEEETEKSSKWPSFFQEEEK